MRPGFGLGNYSYLPPCAFMRRQHAGLNPTYQLGFHRKEPDKKACEIRASVLRGHQSAAQRVTSGSQPRLSFLFFL